MMSKPNGDPGDERPEDVLWRRCLADFRTHGAEVLPDRPGDSVAFTIPPDDVDQVEASKAVAEVLRRSYEQAAVLRFPSGRRFLARLNWDLSVSAYRLSLDPLSNSDDEAR